MATNNILVLGAGELGTAILTSLSKLSPPSTKITVLLRPSTLTSTSPTKLKELAYLKSLNITFLPGDIASSSIPSLASLFSPYDLIISCLGFSSGPGSQIKIARAVLAAKVKRYMPWQFGVDYDVIGRGSAQNLFDEQLDVRDLLRGQNNGGTEWIIVSTGMFTSFLFEESFGLVVPEAKGEEEVIVRALGGWENKVTVTSPVDIGELTARIVFDDGVEWNSVVYTAGESISYGGLADVVESVSGKRVEREVWTVEGLKEELRGDPADGLKKYRVVFAEGRGVSWDVEKTYNVQKGIEVQDVKSFALESWSGAAEE
jgi:hypothetical protein